MGVAVAVIVAVSLVAGVVLATTYLDVQTATVVQNHTSTLTLVSTVTLTPSPTTIVSTSTVTAQSPSRVSINTTTSTVTAQSPSPVSTNTTTSTKVSCTVSGEGGPVYIQLENGSSPLPGVAIDVVHRGPIVNGQDCGTVSLPALYTNSTGWVEIPGDNLPYAGSFLISFVYSASDYNTTIPVQPVTTTYVYVSLPSGEVTTLNCVYDACPTMSDTMGMDG
jgi:hypothetical protein